MMISVLCLAFRYYLADGDMFEQRFCCIVYCLTWNTWLQLDCVWHLPRLYSWHVWRWWILTGNIVPPHYVFMYVHNYSYSTMIRHFLGIND